MAGLSCPSCGTGNDDGEALCHQCGFLLGQDDAPRIPANAQARGDAGPSSARPSTSGPSLAKPPARDTSGTPNVLPPPGDVAQTCPACGAEIPDAANIVCVDCLEPLKPRSSGSGPANIAGPADHTRREAIRLRLLFRGSQVDVATGSVLIGRDPASPAAAVLVRSDNVSRRHATVGIERDGSAWVRDEGSANGTYVNGTPVTGTRTPLSHGDHLRLASDVVATVEIETGGTP